MDRHDIFISYRRTGGDHFAARVAEELKNRGYSVFMDVNDLESGLFNKAIYNKIKEITDIIVILSKDCLELRNNGDDWFRLEISYALKYKRNIIPVKGLGFEQSSFDDLPPDLLSLKNYTSIYASNEIFGNSMKKLITFLKSNPVKHKSNNQVIKEIVEQFEQRLQSSNPEERHWCYIGLGKIKGNRAQQLLVQGLTEQNDYARMGAEDGLHILNSSF
jgi:hypothetical protein